GLRLPRAAARVRQDGMLLEQVRLTEPPSHSPCSRESRRCAGQALLGQREQVDQAPDAAAGGVTALRGDGPALYHAGELAEEDLEALHLLAAAQLPQAQGALSDVEADEPLAVGAEGHAPVSRQVVELAALLLDFLAGLEVPDPDRRVVAEGQALLAVGPDEAERHRADVTLQPPHLIPRRHLPQPHGSVAVAGQDVPVGAEGVAVNLR